MDDVTFERELQKRLQMIESPDGSSPTVADLPPRDFALASITLASITLASITLALAIILLMWWAY